nr:PEP-CTERM sorting domain-containing protein [Saccharophagus degradans]
MNAASVPEPGTMALFGMGMFGLYFSRRKMKRA